MAKRVKKQQEGKSLDARGDLNSQIEDFLKTANEASGAARNAWLAFLGIMAYLLITIASTSHSKLLTNAPVTLPIVDVELPLFSFYAFAPVLFLLVHLGLFIQHAVTANKLNALNEKLRDARDILPSENIDHVRRRLHFYAFAQYLSGPYGDHANTENMQGQVSSTHRWLVRLMLWISFVILPVLTFLAFQISFLPYHDMGEWPDGGLPSLGLTWWHRIVLIADLAVLWIFWPIIRYHLPKWIDCFRKYPPRWQRAKIVATAATLVFSVFVATVPDEYLDKVMASLPSPLSVERGARRVFGPTAWLFEGELDNPSLTLKSPFSRNLVVAIEDLVDDDKKWDKGERSFNLRKRNLKYGQFSRIDLGHADLAHADLTGASFFRARLNNASFAFATINGTKFERASLRRAAFNNTIGNSQTNFRRATADKADFRGAKLPGADFKRARLINAEFQIDDGTDGVRLVADLEGAIFARANLRAADLSGANLRAATFWEANLQAVNLTGARLQGADLRRANVWAADHPGNEDLLIAADLGEISLMRSNEPDCWRKNEQSCEQNADTTKITGPHSSIAWRLDLFDDKEPRYWEDKCNSDKKEKPCWQTRRGEAPPARDVSAFLERMVCRRGKRSVARGVINQINKGRTGDARPLKVRRALADAIFISSDEACPGRKYLDANALDLLKRLSDEAAVVN